MIARGDIWWADLGEPIGSAPGHQRPVIVVQGDAINASRIGTVIVVPLTSTVKWESAPGNLLLRAKAVGLDRDSVANVSQILTVDKDVLVERVGKATGRQLDQIFAGLDLILGR